MSDALAAAYPWIKAAHVVFVIFWIAGLFALPRYVIYQAECSPGSAEDARWVERCVKLRRIILTPSMILVWLLGLTLATAGHWWASGWLGAKFLIVLALSGYHGWAVGMTRKLARGWRPANTRTLRLLNEVPAFAIIAIVVLVVVKPF